MKYDFFHLIFAPEVFQMLLYIFCALRDIGLCVTFWPVLSKSKLADILAFKNAQQLLYYSLCSLYSQLFIGLTTTRQLVDKLPKEEE